MSDKDRNALLAGVTGSNPQVLQQVVDYLQTAAAAAAASGPAAPQPVDQAGLMLWLQLLQATNGGARLPEHALEQASYSSQLKRQRSEDAGSSFSGIVMMDRDRLESIRRDSLQHLNQGTWQQSLSALQRLAAEINSQHEAGEDVDGYLVRRDNTKSGHWTEEEKQQLIALVQQVKPTSAQQWEVIADVMGKWSPKGASAERMYRTLTDPGYYRATNKHGRRLNARTSIPMYIKAVYALLQLPAHEGNLTQISDIIAKHTEFAGELDWTPRPGAKTYPRWKDALLSCFKEGRYPYLEKTAKKSGGSTVYRLKLDALKMDDVQKYVKYLEIPANALPASLAGVGV